MTKKYRTSEVFVPGGMPLLTYVTRTGPDLERRLSRVENNLCKLVVLTGTTKSGKTVLVNKIFPRGDKAVWSTAAWLARRSIFGPLSSKS